jgi:hypothetical protein
MISLSMLDLVLLVLSLEEAIEGWYQVAGDMVSSQADESPSICDVLEFLVEDETCKDLMNSQGAEMGGRRVFLVVLAARLDNREQQASGYYRARTLQDIPK